MKRLSIPIVVVFAIFFSGSSVQSQHKLESWYLYFGLGYANPQYADEVEQVLDDIVDQPNVSHASIGLDLIGFYWPIGGKKTVIGGIINTFGDRYENDNVNISFQLTGVTFAFSTMHYLTNEIGKGLFLRADAGPARFTGDIEGGGISVTASTGWGFGALVGTGYSIPVSAGTRILLNANYAFRRVEGANIGALSLIHI